MIPQPLHTFLGRALQRCRHLIQAIGFILALTSSAWAVQQVIPAPTDSGGAYAAFVVVLPNGNIVVTDLSYSPGGLTNAGAVYLLDGATLNVISTLVGSTANDLVGGGDIIVLTNGNFVVVTPSWDNGSAVDAGAVTWGSATTGFIGGGIAAISAANSLVGTRFGDQVGNKGVTALTNGNYAVASPNWDNDAALDAGAATWGDGSTGTMGSISAANSLVGTHANDHAGWEILKLTNGNYVVSSNNWSSDTTPFVGSATWGDGTGGTTGPISAANSLVGTHDSGSFYIHPLTNGNYVVCKPNWSSETQQLVGAVTWCNGSSGATGFVSATNSLVGSTAGDSVGETICPLTNGNYVVCSSKWSNGAAMFAGAVTWGNGNGGTVGPVTAANSLVGSTANDNVGFFGVIALSNGNYVFKSQLWDGAERDVGAVTWGNGSSGTAGVVSAANSLVGSATGDMGNYGAFNVLTVLTNGNYVVSNPAWDDGAATDAGAVTWGNGNGGTVGPISAANSLVGSASGDFVGYSGVTALSNGHYVVGSSNWSGSIGAVTWGNGSGGTVGEISAANSLVGSTANDGVGWYLGISGVIALTNGSYVVASSRWDNGAVADVGAVTWGNGSAGTSGTISSANSLIGSTAGDSLGLSYFGPGVFPLPNGDYVIMSSLWDNGAVADAGAVTWVRGDTVGAVSAANSVFGAAPSGLGAVTARNYDPVRNRLFVGRGDSKLLSILTLDSLPHLQSWRTQHFGTAANAGNAADTAMPQNDGVPNLMKFATGLNPALRTPQPGVLAKNGGSLEFTYPRSIDAMAECTFTVEWSNTLLAGSWSSSGVTESILSATSTLQQIKATLPGVAGSSRFVRLRVTTP